MWNTYPLCSSLVWINSSNITISPLEKIHPRFIHSFYFLIRLRFFLEDLCSILSNFLLLSWPLFNGLSFSSFCIYSFLRYMRWIPIIYILLVNTIFDAIIGIQYIGWENYDKHTNGTSTNVWYGWVLDHKQRWLDVLEAGKILNGPIKSFIPETFKSTYNDSWNKIATTTMLSLIIIVMII